MKPCSFVVEWEACCIVKVAPIKILLFSIIIFFLKLTLVQCSLILSMKCDEIKPKVYSYVKSLLLNEPPSQNEMKLRNLSSVLVSTTTHRWFVSS